MIDEQDARTSTVMAEKPGKLTFSLKKRVKPGAAVSRIQQVQVRETGMNNEESVRRPVGRPRKKKKGKMPVRENTPHAEDRDSGLEEGKADVDDVPESPQKSESGISKRRSSGEEKEEDDEEASSSSVEYKEETPTRELKSDFEAKISVNSQQKKKNVFAPGEEKSTESTDDDDDVEAAPNSSDGNVKNFRKEKAHMEPESSDEEEEELPKRTVGRPRKNETERIHRKEADLSESEDKDIDSPKNVLDDFEYVKRTVGRSRKRERISSSDADVPETSSSNVLHAELFGSDDEVDSVSSSSLEDSSEFSEGEEYVPKKKAGRPRKRRRRRIMLETGEDEEEYLSRPIGRPAKKGSKPQFPNDPNAIFHKTSEEIAEKRAEEKLRRESLVNKIHVAREAKRAKNEGDEEEVCNQSRDTPERMKSLIQISAEKRAEKRAKAQARTARLREIAESKGLVFGSRERKEFVREEAAPPVTRQAARMMSTPSEEKEESTII